MNDTKVYIREILETIPDAIIAINAEGVIQLFNLAAEPMFQYNADEVIGKHFSILFPSMSERTEIMPNYTETLTAVTQSKREFPVEFRAGEMNFDGHKLFACVIRDISDRVRAEHEAEAARDQLIQAEKLASLGELVAGVAHEINTPLGISVTAASHLRERYHRLHEQYQNQNLQRSSLESFFDTCEQSTTILATNLQRASDLIRSFKQIAVDQSSDAPRRINLDQYLHELILSLRPRLKKRPIEVHIECPERLEITTYPGAISQILTNLIINSLIHGYTPEQTGHIKICCTRTDERLIMEYEDDGRGIPEQQLNRVFEPFFTTQRANGSSGLGLHIVYNLVTQTLNGSLKLISRPDQGVHFHIEFPIQYEAP